MEPERFQRQLRFIAELDKLKQVERRTYLLDQSRRETVAEHSWHIAVMALLLAEYSNAASLDLSKVIRMTLVHDIVEIDAGDTFCYDAQGNADKAQREQRAADRLFGLLPDDQAAEMRDLWEEFEARDTAEARFAAALDRLQPLCHNYATGGATWQEHGVTADQVVDRNQHIAAGSNDLWEYAQQMIRESEQKGLI